MRSALQTVNGVSDIETDIPKRAASFQLGDKDLDVKAKLDELAKTTEHLRGWTIVETQ